MRYDVVFDVSQTSPPYLFALFGIVIGTLGAGIAWFVLDRFAALRMALAIGVFVFGLAWSSVFAYVAWNEQARATAALDDGTAGVVEGVVADFQDIPEGGKGYERFTVGDVHFKYSDHITIAGMHRTRRSGGPMRPGQHVRIHYAGPASDATILRLEIARS